jgi:metallophosphoesterase (TIGR00282 family)
MKLVFIGDIVGKPGRQIVAQRIREIREAWQPDILLANAENSAGGLGATPEVIEELKKLGIVGFTMGNHTWRKKSIIPAMPGLPELVRPANYPPGMPGKGHTVITLPDGRKLGLLNLIGRVYMEPNDCPFRAADTLLPELLKETRTILVDMHAEATSEKIAMGWHLDGRCSAVVGTHTHVQTADNWIMPGGTAFITDVGMCGPIQSVIGTDKDVVVKKFLSGMPEKFEVATGAALLSAVAIEIDDATGQARSINRILIRDEKVKKH